MSAIYMSQLYTTPPLMEGDHHQDHRRQGHFQAFTLPKDPPVLFPFVINNSSPSDSSLIYGSDHHLRQHQAILGPQHMIGGSSSVFATPFPTVESIRDDMIERSSYDPYDMEKLQATGGAVKADRWTAPAAAKMTITRKMNDPGVGGAAKKPRRRGGQAYEDHSHSGGGGGGMNQTLGVIRVCSDCNTTKTPLWRSGPCGPKSLCNACGIRQRKARRAMMATGASTDGTKVGTPSDAATAHPKVKKQKRADVDRSLPFKKRCKLVVQDHTAATAAAAAADDKANVKSTEVGSAVPTRDHVDSIGINWGKGSAAAAACFRPSPAFAVQDEITDAAMLLMTLSCGLVRS